MSCKHFGGAIICCAHESEPFFFNGRRFVVNERWGPAAVNKHGDPLAVQPSGRMLQAAYEHYLKTRTDNEP